MSYPGNRDGSIGTYEGRSDASDQENNEANVNTAVGLENENTSEQPHLSRPV